MSISYYGSGYRIPEKTRQRKLAENDGFCYVCCLRPSTQVDHVRPVAEGGPHHDDNLAGICTECHQIKSAEEAKRGRERRAFKRRQPTHPGLTDAS